MLVHLYGCPIFVGDKIRSSVGYVKAILVTHNAWITRVRTILGTKWIWAFPTVRRHGDWAIRSWYLLECSFDILPLRFKGKLVPVNGNISFRIDSHLPFEYNWILTWAWSVLIVTSGWIPRKRF